VTFARTDLLGVYTVTGIADPEASADPSSSPAASPSSSAATGAAGASPGASPSFRPADPGGPVRFAVDLLDVNESTIAPGDIAKITGLGEAAPDQGAGGGTAAPEDRPYARDELWIPIVLVALLVLTAEWLVYERDTLARLRRAVAGRLRGPGRAGGSA
jgi:hypothetical protein